MRTTSVLRMRLLWVTAVMLLLLQLTLAINEAPEEEKLDTPQKPVVRQPPSITKSPPREVIFQPGVEIKLTCEAAGKPEPDYRWEKDGDIPDSTLGLKVNKGEITVEGYFNHAGRYRCFASNQWGVAMTDFIDVKMAVMSRITGNDVTNIQVLQGDPITMSCGNVKSVPAASFSWWTSKDQLDDDLQELGPSPRIVHDEDGNLHYSYALPSDSKNGDIYRCRSFNSRLDQLQGGSYHQIEVISRIPDHTEPKQLYSSLQRTDDPYITALVGHNLTLKCAFAAYPQVSYSWNFNDAPTSQHSLLDYKSTLQIVGVRMQDEGKYTCVGVNDAGKGLIHIPVKVFEIPTFRNPAEKPHDTVVTEGEAGNFYCRATGKPTPTVKWFKNGDPLEDPAPGSKFMYGDDDTHLIINDLCKTCGPGGDLMTIQCNSSNEYGYTFASGFLNVLLPTVITVEPENVLLEAFEGFAEFTCEASTDDLMRDDLSLAWKFKGDYIRMPVQDEDDATIWMTRDKMVRNKNAGQILMVDTTKPEIVDYEGVYTCVASTRYSRDEKNATLTLPAGVIVTPTEGPVVNKGGVGGLWWIFILVALLLFLIILLLCCCLCMQRNKGDTYPVDEKERAQGNDPEKELADSGFHDYQRPEDGPMKGSRASLTSTIKLDSDDDVSLAEYGDIDTGKFNEDGSFIGQYATDKRRRPPTESNI